MNLPRVVVWVSAGAASAIAGKMALQKYGPRVLFAYCETGAEHPDNQRVLTDLEGWYGQPIERLKSEKYDNIFEVWEARKYMAGINGAPCTVELKVKPRLKFQRVDDIHIFGYTADGPDVARAARLREHFFELTVETPLIEAGVTKEGCLALMEGAGIAPSIMYALGFPNANCIGCVKATSPNYWALIRLHFPEIFWRIAKISRELGARLCRINGERSFIDEIPEDWPTTNPLVPSCDFLCHLAEQDLDTRPAMPLET